MDPIAHTFTGATLAAAGLRRATPLATAALILGANAPDVDVLVAFAGDYASVAHRRGWTHGVLALAVWPFVLTALLLAWDRWVRRQRAPSAAAARAGPLLALSGLAVVTHPTLDWVNNYGMRWLMPFDGRWFYGDALVVVDPWLWLTLGGVLFLMHSQSRLARARWAAFWLLASILVLANSEIVPPLARVVWFAGVGALVAVRALGWPARWRAMAAERAAVGALAFVAAYIGLLVIADYAERAQVATAFAGARIDDVERVMVAPAVANPFAGEVVASTPERYYTGRWNWFGKPRFVPDGEAILRPRGAVFDAASQAPAARRFLVWARFPYIEVEQDPAGGTLVQFSDARYRFTERLGGPAVRLDHELRVVDEAAPVE